MELNFNGFWASKYHLYKVKNDIEVYRYLKNKKWKPANRVYNQLGWNIDFDHISETKAKKIMKEIDTL